MRVSSTATLIDALLVTGFPYTVHQSGEELVSLFAAFLSEAQAVRRLGSAALDLCYVAAGRMDAFWEQHLKPWDMAAGALMLAEAGGRITALDGGPFDVRKGQLMASNGVIHDAPARCRPPVARAARRFRLRLTSGWDTRRRGPRSRLGISRGRRAGIVRAASPTPEETSTMARTAVLALAVLALVRRRPHRRPRSSRCR